MKESVFFLNKLKKWRSDYNSFFLFNTYGPILPSLNSGFEIFQNIKIRTFQNLLRNFL